MSVANDTWARGIIRAKMLGLIGNKGDFAQELKDAILIWVGVHGKPLKGFVKNHHPLTLEQAEQLLWEAMCEKTNNLVKAKEREVRLLMMPHLPPVRSMRRAA